MTSRHPLLAGSSRVQQAASGNPPLASGERGEAVVRLQLALITLGASLPLSTAEQSKVPDGVFGSETLQGVRAFQARHSLKVDGIVGKNTLAKLDEQLPLSAPKVGCCANGRRGNAERALGFIGGANFRAAFSASVGGIVLPSGVRFLTPAQEGTARGIFGSSLDFTRIVLTDATGLGGRPFTAAVEVLPSCMSWSSTPAPSRPRGRC